MIPTDGEMIGVAKRRGIVRLDDGQLATLVSWGARSGGRNGRPNRLKVRLETQDGERRWTDRKTRIVEVVHPGVESTWTDRADYDDSAGADRREHDRSVTS